MIEMTLSSFCFVLAAIGWSGFNQKEKNARHKCSYCLAGKTGAGGGKQRERETMNDSDGGTSHPPHGVLVLRSALPKTELPLSPACPQQYAGEPGACYLRNIMLINVLRCWTFPLPVL